MQPVSSLTDSGFVPRKEFIRDQRTTSDFSLLAISGSSFIRLYSFSLEVIADLRRLFDHFYLNAACREDTAQKLCEFQLHGKPWASPKSARTERILLDILAVIYRHCYNIVSTVDYGRERDDRLAIAFSRLSAPPLAFPPHSPIPAGSGSNLSHGTGGKHERKTPFAISFISSTVMRVIYPPLNSTPAILQAVRGSWPRGVVSEKKVGDAAYEFKLKGYSCEYTIFIVCLLPTQFSQGSTKIRLQPIRFIKSCLFLLLSMVMPAQWLHRFPYVVAHGSRICGSSSDLDLRTHTIRIAQSRQLASPVPCWMSGDLTEGLPLNPGSILMWELFHRRCTDG